MRKERPPRQRRAKEHSHAVVLEASCSGTYAQDPFREMDLSVGGQNGASITVRNYWRGGELSVENEPISS